MSESGTTDQENQASRSESYFKMHNSHSKPGSSRLREEKFRRPSSSSASSPSSPASTSSLTPHDVNSHRAEPLRTKLRDVTNDSPEKSYPKIKHYESDFRPIEGPTTEEPKRPQRLVNHRYNPYHHNSEESDESASGSHELYRKEPKYADYDGSGEHYLSSEEYGFKNEKGYKGDKKPSTSFRSGKPLHGGNYKHYSDAPDFKSHDYSSIYKSTPYGRLNTPTPPPGMSEELMETLLQQEPQKFSDSEKVKRYEPRKKFKSAGGDSPTAFNVGYSIGFGGAPSDDVIFGKPKDPSLKLHVNGEKSVWKQLNNGVEMSHSLDRIKPLHYRVPDTTSRPKINVLNHGGSSVYYLNSNSPEVDSIPTVGKNSFDHNKVLTSTNMFDISNAMPGPIALPLQSNLVPETQPFSHKAKSGRQLDIMNLYQSMGYSPPIPVLIPGPKGEAQMVHAIVIPLQSVPNVDLGWGQLPGLYSPTGLMAGSSAPQPVQYFPSPLIAPLHNTHQNPIHSSGSSYKQSSHHSNLHPVSNPFPAIPEKVRSQKYRKAKDAFKSGSAFSSPIVVQPIPQKVKSNIQKELNAILAQEMSRKNQRHTPLGLRPPPPQ